VYTVFMEKKVLNYRIIIEKESYEDGSLVYVAYCPTLGISDYADTVEEVLSSIKDGIELAVESLAKEEKEVPVDHIEEQIITSTKIDVPSGIKISIA
jgi:predicted RNase H-like HicB family nuclease